MFCSDINISRNLIGNAEKQRFKGSAGKDQRANDYLSGVCNLNITSFKNEGQTISEEKWPQSHKTLQKAKVSILNTVHQSFLYAVCSFH